MNNPQERWCFTHFCRISRLYFEGFKFLMCIPCQRKIELRDPQQVLRTKLGDDLEVIDFKTESLVKTGDNYGSTIMKVTVNTKIKDKFETLHLVAKMLPSSRFLRKLYECDFTVAKEIFFYEEVIPAYQKLYGFKLDIVPKFYGGRLAIKPNQILIDEGAVILLENLKENGYFMVDRFEGLNMEHMSHVITTMAKFHAIGLAMKHWNPEFYLKMQNYTKPLEMPEDVMGVVVSEILKLIRSTAQTREYYDRVKGLTKSAGKTNCLMQIELESEDPWACLVHRDFWKNNVMFRMEHEKIIDLKVFDFQNYCLSSPMTDLIYFLWTSMERNFQHFDEIVEFYRNSVQKNLLEFGCDASMFQEEIFNRRLKKDARSEIFHSIMIAKAVEFRSVLDVMQVNDNLIFRVRRILEIYDEKGWF